MRSHFSWPHVLYAGSYEDCACGFNFGREFPPFEDDLERLVAAAESVAELVRYVRDARVREIYGCIFGDESKPTLQEQTLAPDDLASPDFFFREQELVRIAL